MIEKNLFEIIRNANSKNDVLLKYYGYSNKTTYDKLDILIKKYNIDVSHFEKKIKYCLFCGKPIISKYNKFCNSSCAASFNNKNRILSTETKNKISNRLKNSVKVKRTKNEIKLPELTRICIICNNEFIVNVSHKGSYLKNKCCSDTCRNKLRSDNQKKYMENAIFNGSHKGWQTRNIISYPEQFFINVLKNNNIDFSHNFPINKNNLGLRSSCNYFLDFYLKNKNIDLEIDGSQHKYRKEHDIERDKILKENGFNVYRIKWKSINSESGKIYIENEIKKFLEFYENS
jgi:hypothetical protein